MNRALLLALACALALVLLMPGIVRAEVIDYDPQTQPPEILSEEELAKYAALRSGGSRPSIISPVTPNGQYVLVSVGGGTYSVLDIDTREITPVPGDVWNPSLVLPASEFAWSGDSTAVFMTCHKENPSFYAECVEFAKSTFDFAAMTLTSEPIDVAEVPSKDVRFTPYPFYPFKLPLLATTDGKLHALGFTVSSDTVLTIEDRERYDVRTDEAREERVALGVQPPPRVLQSTGELLVAVDLASGGVTAIGEIPPNSSLDGALLSVSQRPGTDTVSYVVLEQHPCQGENIRGRSCRGGGMPTSFWNVQERLGLIPEAENDFILGSEMRLFDLSDGTETVIRNRDHAPGLFAATQWTGDGSRLLVQSALPARLDGRLHAIYGSPSHSEIKVFSPAGEPQGSYSDPILTGLGVDFSANGDTGLLVMAPHNTNRHLYLVDAANFEAEPQTLYAGRGTLYGWELAGSVLVFVHGDATVPGELYIGETSDVEGTADQLTDLNEGLLAVSDLAFEPIRYTTSGGYDVEGVYVYPADQEYPPTSPQPVVVWQAGGPGGQMTNSWGTSVESPYSMLPNFGIPVFVVNGSGRMSNGPGFYTDMAQARNYGQRDIRDVKEGVDHLIAEGVVDPDAVGVTGCSYGGYFTLQSLVEFPDFYSAGNTQCSLNDLMWEYNFGWADTIGYLMGAPPTRDPAEYAGDSPVYRAHQIRSPLLIFHGTNDFLPYEHMTNVHDQLAMNGVQTRFLRVLREGHGFGWPTSQLYAAQLQIEWFREHLGIEGADDVVWSHQPMLRIVPDPLRSRK